MSNYKKFIINTVKGAGKIAARNFRKPQKIDWKDKKQIVTETDFKVNKYIINKIKINYPDHNIISEESPLENNKSDYSWFIDPIDGTIAFSHGMPFFSIAVALSYKNKIIYSAIYDPIHHEFFYAEKGKGIFFNGKKIKSKLSSLKLSDAAISFGVWADAPYNLIYLESQLIPKIYTRLSIHSLALYACYVVLGRVDGVIFAGSSPWDIAPLSLICKEAGVKVTGITGKKWVPPFESKGAVIARPGLHKELMKVIKRYYKN